jgi:hypothetical protein
LAPADLHDWSLLNNLKLIINADHLALEDLDLARAQQRGRARPHMIVNVVNRINDKASEAGSEAADVPDPDLEDLDDNTFGSPAPDSDDEAFNLAEEVDDDELE